jgi:hypothetical protein
VDLEKVVKHVLVLADQTVIADLEKVVKHVLVLADQTVIAVQIATATQICLVIKLLN